MKAGFITLVGIPNVGKSSLLNSLVGSKVSIVTNKPQTTRNIIRGIYNSDSMQAIFVDTPGIHKPHHKLGEKMVDISFKAIRGVDICMFVVSAKDNIELYQNTILNRLKLLKIPVFLVINKIDLLKNKIEIDKLILKYKEYVDFASIIPISVLDNTNIDKLLNEVEAFLPESPMLYPNDITSDQGEEFFIKELIREKVIMKTKEEVPFSIAVTDLIIKDDEKPTRILATIIVERASQKGIIIGKGGSMLKEIGTEARKDIVRIFGEKIYLELWVKVKNDWRNRLTDVNNMGNFSE